MKSDNVPLCSHLEPEDVCKKCEAEETHDSLCGCKTCHISAVAAKDIDPDNCPDCLEAARHNYEITKENL